MQLAAAVTTFLLSSVSFLLICVCSLVISVSFLLVAILAVTRVFLHERLHLHVQTLTRFVSRVSRHLLDTHLFVAVVAFAARLLVFHLAFHQRSAKFILFACLHRSFQFGARLAFLLR